MLIRFKDDQLHANTPPTAGVLKDDWYVIHETPSKTSGPLVDTGTKTFKQGGPGDLGIGDNVRRAATWDMVKSVMDFLTDQNLGIEFKKSITVVYPAKVVSGVSCANGVTRMVYIHSTRNREQWNADTIIHEVMHLWNYQHNHGVANWLAAVCFDFDTHGFQEQPAIAFHEGFAEFAKNELMHHIWGRGKTQPLSRFGLAQLDLNDIATVEQNDTGVTRALHLLTTPDIYTRVFGVATQRPPGVTNNDAGTTSISNLSCPASPNIQFGDVLKVFLPDTRPGSEWPTFWPVGKKDNGVVLFYKRASDLLPQFDKATKALCLQLLDANSTVEPQSRCVAG